MTPVEKIFRNALLLCLLTASSLALSQPLSPQQTELMVQEAHAVSTLRHKLRELLERQQFEEGLQEGQDVYTDFYQLDQWLQQLKKDSSSANLEEMLKVLHEFEQHVSQVLERQESLSSLLSSSSQETPTPSIELSKLMQEIRRLLKEGKIEEAQQLLNQILEMFDRQQRQLETSVEQYYDSKFSKIQESLRQMLEHVQQSRQTENLVQKEIQPYHQSSELPEKSRQFAAPRQQQVTEAHSDLSRLLENMPQSPLLPLDPLKPLIEESRQASRSAEHQIHAQQGKPAFEAVEAAQENLSRLQQTLMGFQQQAQQLSQVQSQRTVSSRQGRYWGEKGVRPLKFEHDFQPNPQYRDEIQKFNQQKYPNLTPTQSQYLEEIIR